MFADIELYLSFTEECNWNCPYCGYPNIKNPKTISLDDFKKVSKWMKPIIDKYQMQICIEGGEIGLVDESLLDHLFYESGFIEHQEHKFHVATNGMFMNKGYHKKYGDLLRSILFHVAPDITSPNITFKRYDESLFKMYYTMVIHYGNLDFMEEFIKNNEDIDFTPHIIQPRIDGLDIMGLNEYNKIYSMIQNKPNISLGLVYRYKYITENFNNTELMRAKREFCCQNYKKFIIDLPNNIIRRCCVSNETDWIELTPENLDELLENKKETYPSWEKLCENCIAGFIFKDHPKEIIEEVMPKLKKESREEIIKVDGIK
jgi:organic radical activating enzyme